jgi:hypothetical protein
MAVQLSEMQPETTTNITHQISAQDVGYASRQLPTTEAAI